MPETTKKVPRAALTFTAPINFADADDTKPKEAPISLFARAPKAVQHWYWGKIEHDIEGMQVRKETCPIDWCHSREEIIGVADQFDASAKKGLTIGGRLVSVFDEDRADQIMRQGLAGIPFEASIDFNGPMRLEEVGQGMKTKVNGHDFEGPGVVVREWTLRSVAVCPYGVDHYSRSKFAGDEPEEIEVTLFSETDPMPVKTDPTLAPAPAGEPKLELTPPAPAPTSPADPAVEFQGKLDAFVKHFGPANGSKWAAEKKTELEAWALHCEALTKQLAELKASTDATIAELNQKLAAIPRGETDPVSGGDASKPTPASGDAAKLSTKLGDNLAKVAASIKLPGRA